MFVRNLFLLYFPVKPKTLLVRCCRYWTSVKRTSQKCLSDQGNLYPKYRGEFSYFRFVEVFLCHASCEIYCVALVFLQIACEPLGINGESLIMQWDMPHFIKMANFGFNFYRSLPQEFNDKNMSLNFSPYSSLFLSSSPEDVDGRCSVYE